MCLGLAVTALSAPAVHRRRIEPRTRWRTTSRMRSCGARVRAPVRRTRDRSGSCRLRECARGGAQCRCGSLRELPPLRLRITRGRRVIVAFFATFSTWLNGISPATPANNTAKIASLLQPAVLTLASIYVMVWGYLQLTGKIEEPFVAGLKRIILLVVHLRRWAGSVALQRRHRRYVLQRAGATRRRRHRRLRSGRHHRSDHLLGRGCREPSHPEGRASSTGISPTTSQALRST